MLVRQSEGETPWLLFRSDTTWSSAGELPAALTSSRRELDLVAEASAIHLLAWEPFPAASAEHAVSLDGGRHWIGRPTLPAPPNAIDDAVEIARGEPGSPAVLRAGGQRWWLGSAATSTAQVRTLDLPEGSRLLAADGSALAQHGRVSLLVASRTDHGTWKISIHDFVAV